MSLKDKFKAFWNSTAANILALIIGIAALVITFVMLADRAEASELVVDGEALDYPSFSGTEVEDYITDDCSVLLEYYYFGSSNWGYRLYIIDDSDVTAYLSAGNYGRDLINVIGDYSSYHIFTCTYSSFEWSYLRTVSGNSFTSELSDGEEILASTFDIYADSSYSELFFHQTPLYTPPTVAGVMTGQQMSQSLMMEVIGLVPLLVGLVISVIALKKGWKFLRARLNTG